MFHSTPKKPLSLSLHELYMLAANLPEPEAVARSSNRRGYEALLEKIGNEIRRVEAGHSQETAVLTGNTILDLFQKARPGQ